MGVPVSVSHIPAASHRGTVAVGRSSLSTLSASHSFKEHLVHNWGMFPVSYSGPGVGLRVLLGHSHLPSWPGGGRAGEAPAQSRMGTMGDEGVVTPGLLNPSRYGRCWAERMSLGKEVWQPCWARKDVVRGTLPCRPTPSALSSPAGPLPALAVSDTAVWRLCAPPTGHRVGLQRGHAPLLPKQREDRGRWPW